MGNRRPNKSVVATAGLLYWFASLWTPYSRRATLRSLDKKMDIYSITSLVFAALTLLYAIDQNRRKRQAEKELSEITRRGRAPYLLATHMDVRIKGEQQNQIFRPGEDTIVKITEGEVIKLDLHNQGEEVRNVTDNWKQGEGIGTYGGKITNHDHSSAYIVYRFDLSKHGQKKNIEISFETNDGLQLKQIYTVTHGLCEIERIDPK